MKKYENRQTDFPELEGKIIDYRPTAGMMVKAKVIGCNFDIGITLACQDDPEKLWSKGKEIFCSNGPCSPYKHRYKQDTYSKAFYASVKMIKRGFFDPIVVRAIINNVTYKKAKSAFLGGADYVYCGFGA